MHTVVVVFSSMLNKIEKKSICIHICMYLCNFFLYKFSLMWKNVSECVRSTIGCPTVSAEYLKSFENLEKKKLMGLFQVLEKSMEKLAKPVLVWEKCEMKKKKN